MAFIPPLHMCAPPDQLYNEVWLPLTSAVDTSEPIVAHMEAQVNDQMNEISSKWKDQVIMGCTKAANEIEDADDDEADGRADDDDDDDDVSDGPGDSGAGAVATTDDVTGGGEDAESIEATDESPTTTSVSDAAQTPRT